MEKKLQYFDALDALIIAVLFSNNSEPIKGRLWLQKIVFVLDRNIEQIKAIFDGYYIGPYSERVTLALERFIGSGYVDITSSGKIFLTDKGKELASSIIKKITKEKYDLINEVKEFLNGMNRIELIAFTYSTFPEYTDKSDVYEEYLRTRLQASISLYKKGKISLEKASEIAGIPLVEYIKIIKNNI